MKVDPDIWASICVFVMVASSAPIAEDEQRPEYLEYDNRQGNYQRGQRLSENYYAITPCAAAAAARSFAPNTLYHNDLGARFVPSSYEYGQGFPGNMYRADDPYNDNREALSFSDMNFIEDVPTGRSNYRIAPSPLLLKGANFANIKNQLVHEVAPAVYGVYPNGNAGGCNMPLFFSCTPSVVSGRVTRSEPQFYNTPVITHPEYYRGVGDYQDAQGNVEQAIAPVSDTDKRKDTSV
uniref:VMP26 n=1 Tax=Heliconius melpomene TaxID=34740 RepID=J7G6P9_HELME|nr:VMP26 [Heliconius melpomene]